MKRPRHLLIAAVLGTCTLGLQLPLSLSESTAAASDNSKEVALHEGILRKRIPRKIRIVSTTAIPLVSPKKKVLPVAGPARTGLFVASATPVEVTDPLAAVVHPDIQKQHQDVTRKVLGVFPSSCQSQLKNFYVIYGDPLHRGAAGLRTIVMNGALSIARYVKLLAHESAHFWDLTCLVGTPESGESAFPDGAFPTYNNDPSVEFYSISWESSTKRRAGAKAHHFVSVYALTNPFEDMADTAAYFRLQPEAMHARAAEDPVMAAKLAWMEKYFPPNAQLGTGSTWNGVVPPDAAQGEYTVLAQYL